MTLYGAMTCRLPCKGLEAPRHSWRHQINFDQTTDAGQLDSDWRATHSSLSRTVSSPAVPAVERPRKPDIFTAC